jgi:LysR family hydrogen peroxide-inducible transcriptional activator
LIAIAEAGSISRASAELFVAQSSLSQFLKQYEDQIGHQMFVRSRHGLIPTEAGNIMIEVSRQILKIYADAQQQILDSEDNLRGNITFGVSPFREAYVLPDVLPLFFQHYPDIHVDIVEATSGELEDMVSKSKIDIAFAACPLNLDTNKYIHLLDEEIFIGCCKDHPLAELVHTENNGRKWIDISETLPFPYIMQASSSRIRKIIDPLFNACSATPKILQYTQNAEAAIRLAKKGYGLVIIPGTYTLHMHDPLEFISLGENGISRSLVIIYPPHGYISKAASKFIDMIKLVLAGSP